MSLTEILANPKKERWNTAFFFFLSGITTATWTSRIPDIQQKLNLNYAAWGTILFALPVGQVTGLAIASWLVAKYGSRSMMLYSSVAVAIALALTGCSASPLTLVLVLLLSGVARTVMNIAINTNGLEVQQHFSKPIMATFHGLWSVACFIAAGITTVMVLLVVPVSLHFSLIAIICVVLSFLLLWRRPAYGSTGERRPFFVTPDKYLFLLGIMALCSMLCEGAMFDWSVNYFTKVVAAKKSYVTLGYSCFIVAMAAGRLIGDRIVAAFGLYPVLMMNGVLIATGFLIAALYPFLLPAAFGFLLIGAGDSILVPVIYVLASKTTIMPPGYALSSVTLIGYAGFLIGPLFIGNVSQYFGMQTAYFVLSAVSLLIVVLALLIKRAAIRIAINNCCE